MSKNTDGLPRDAKRVREWLFGIVEMLEEGQSGGLKLFAAAPSGRGKDLVQTYQLDGRTSVDQLALQIYGTAIEELDGVEPGLHKFAIYAYRDGEDSHFSRMSFKMYAEDSEAEFKPDVTDQTGIIAMLARHLEATQKTHVASLASAFHAMERVTQSLEIRNRMYEENQLQLFGMMREFYTANKEVEYQIERARAEDQKRDEILERILTMGGVVLQKYLTEGEGNNDDSGNKES